MSTGGLTTAATRALARPAPSSMREGYTASPVKEKLTRLRTEIDHMEGSSSVRGHRSSSPATRKSKISSNRRCRTNMRLRRNRISLELEAPPGFEPGMEVLQTSALPLGDGADRRTFPAERGTPHRTRPHRPQ